VNLKQIKWSKSIKFTLIKWFLLLSLLPISFITWQSNDKFSDSLQSHATDALRHSTEFYANYIGNWFFYRELDISEWSNRKATLKFMQELNQNYQNSTKTLNNYINSYPYTVLMQKYQNDFIKLSRHYDYIYDLFIFDTKGNLLYTVAKEKDLGTNYNHGPYSNTLFAKTLQKTLKDGKVHYSDLERYEPSNQGIYGFLTAPIIDEEGDIIGAMAVQIKLNRVFKIFKNITEHDHRNHHYLVGIDGYLRSPIDNNYDTVLLKQIQTKQVKLFQEEHQREHEELHNEEVIKYLGPNNQWVLGLHRRVAILDVKYGLVSEINEDALLASSTSLTNANLLIVLTLFIIIIFSAIFISRRFTAPIETLTNVAIDISKHKAKKTVTVETDNELSHLANAYNQMIIELNNNEHILKSRSMAVEKALHELKEQKFALDAHAIVGITNIEGTITYVNQKFVDISGYSKEELLGSNHRILNSGYHPRIFWTEMFQTVMQGEVWHGLVKNIAKDGRYYWVQTTIVPFLDEHRNIISYTAIRMDVTEQVHTQEALVVAKEKAEVAAQTKAEFLASMSHEIRTPMNGVLGMLSLLKNSNLDQNQRHQATIAQSSAESLLTLINDILDFSKIEAGKLDLDPVEFHLRNELGNLSEAIAFRAQEKDVELIFDVKDIEHTLVIADPSRLRQILTNLIGNAIKFTHNGEIVVTASLKKLSDTTGNLSFSIKDSGIGIPEDKITHLFDSFTQVDASTTRKYGGTGLGLSIVKQLVELMGGHISVESTLNEGSTFSFYIEVNLSPHTSLVRPSVSVEGKKVLIIDDNEINRMVASEQLSHWGLKTYLADDAKSALTICQDYFERNHSIFDIALVDMQMPEMDGAQLGKIIRENQNYHSMKLVMMTSLGSRSDAQLFADIGYDAFFPKPITTNDLFLALNVLIEDKEALRESEPLLTKDHLHALEEHEEGIPSWPENSRILLVEDNVTNQLVANGILETFGLQAEVANQGEEALEILNSASDEKPFTLVLMDCQMPVLDGWKTTEAIREGQAGEFYKDITIVAMTANAMKGDKEACYAAGMNDYLAKPITGKSVENILRKWLLPG